MVKNRVTNAQLAAYLGVVPSTIQFWRKNKKPISHTYLLILSEKLGISYQEAKEAGKQGKLMAMVEERYIKEGEPLKFVTGRDFTDPERAHKHPLKARFPYE